MSGKEGKWFLAASRCAPADGDVVCFDGDAVILGWFTAEEDELPLMALKAAACCQAMIKHLDLDQTRPELFPLPEVGF